MEDSMMWIAVIGIWMLPLILFAVFWVINNIFIMKLGKTCGNTSAALCWIPFGAFSQYTLVVSLNNVSGKETSIITKIALIGSLLMFGVVIPVVGVVFAVLAAVSTVVLYILVIIAMLDAGKAIDVGVVVPIILYFLLPLFGVMLACIILNNKILKAYEE